MYNFLYKTKTTNLAKYKYNVHTHRKSTKYNHVLNTFDKQIPVMNLKCNHAGCTLWILHVNINSSVSRNHTNDNSVQKLNLRLL